MLKHVIYMRALYQLSRMYAMAEPPLLKKKKFKQKEEEKTSPCVICELPCIENQKVPSEEQWNEFQSMAREWQVINGKYSNVHNNVVWEKGPIGHLWHKTCKWQMCNRKTLEQQTKKFRGKEVELSSNSSFTIQPCAEGANKSFTRTDTGCIYERNLCVWCMKGKDPKHAEQTELRPLQQMQTWYKFKASVLHISEPKLGTRLRMLVDSTVDPIAAKICYHAKCFKKYMRPIYETSQCESNDNIQLVNLDDVKQIFLNQVYQMIFCDGEARTLKKSLNR
jgi:hypothetical protein